MSVNVEYIEKLREAVAQQYGKSIDSPSEFASLSAAIKDVTQLSLSTSTLERVWGYVKGYKTVRRNTLNVLSRYVGCRDWDEFCGTFSSTSVSDWGTTGTIALSSLNVGDRVEVRWSPGRRIVVRYLGQGKMCVEESIRSKLAVGDTFICAGMVNGDSLVLLQVMHAGKNEVMTYVCGKHGGIMAQKL